MIVTFTKKSNTVGITSVWERINYTPDPIDEYSVVVKLIEDWEIVHNYIINENEIDNIPNRRITCLNTNSPLSRSAIYSMSSAEAEILKGHEKIMSVELNQEKYPQSVNFDVVRYKNDIAFNKPLQVQLDSWGLTHGSEEVYTNGIRSNWSHTFINNVSSKPYRGVGIASTSTTNTDISYSLSGKNIDTIIIDSGVSPLHPEFLDGYGKTRVKDLILDGPYSIDPQFFDNNGYTYTKIVDGVDAGVGIATTTAHEWWGDSSKRSSKFSSVEQLTIPASYTLEQAFSKNASSNPIISGHGTACASQIGGKNFGLAHESNIWSTRISLGDAGGILAASVSLKACSAWHKSKKINSKDPNPTIINCSWGASGSNGNDDGTEYSYTYRGTSKTYTGNSSNPNPPTDSGPCRNNLTFSIAIPDGESVTRGLVSQDGGGFKYSNYVAGAGGGAEIFSDENDAAETCISEGCILVTSAGNDNQKLCNKDDVDFNNKNSTFYINRIGGVKQGFSGDHNIGKGTIRVGSIDVGVEPDSERQGVSKYSIRKVYYSNNGPMIDVFAPGESTMAAGYSGSYEDFQRQDDSNYYDTWFSGTSSACPNTVSLLALYLQSNRKANQDDVRYWLWNCGSRHDLLGDPVKSEGTTSSDDLTNGYWSGSYSASHDYPDRLYDAYNIKGSGNLRGAPNRVLFNPYANDVIPSIKNVSVKGIHITHK